MLGEIRQMAYVVPDIEQAMRHWSSVLGVGPWFCNDHVPLTEFTYYGKPSVLPDMSIALANSGGLQIELIEQHNDAPSLYRDFLLRGGPGMQHCAFWTLAFDDEIRRLVELGYVEGHAGRIGQRGRFAYLVHPDMPGTVVEVSEPTGGKGEFFRKVKEASIGWDGEEPIRRSAKRT